VFHLYVVQVADRGQLQQKLDEAGIGTGIHYPVALHVAKAYENLGFHAGEFPVAERAAKHILSLPMFPGMTHQQQDRIVGEVLKALAVASWSGER
jgi:dTDP-4-amino-4,6-dideoxygalactose transaminase